MKALTGSLTVAATLGMASFFITATPKPAFANCSPPCYKGQVCQHDASRSPPYYCEQRGGAPAGKRN